MRADTVLTDSLEQAQVHLQGQLDAANQLLMHKADKVRCGWLATSGREKD